MTIQPSSVCKPLEPTPFREGPVDKPSYHFKKNDSNFLLILDPKEQLDDPFGVFFGGDVRIKHHVNFELFLAEKRGME